MNRSKFHMVELSSVDKNAMEMMNALDLFRQN
jgi:hypothetical protein